MLFFSACPGTKSHRAGLPWPSPQSTLQPKRLQLDNDLWPFPVHGYSKTISITPERQLLLYNILTLWNSTGFLSPILGDGGGRARVTEQYQNVTSDTLKQEEDPKERKKWSSSNHSHPQECVCGYGPTVYQKKKKWVSCAPLYPSLYVLPSWNRELDVYKFRRGGRNFWASLTPAPCPHTLTIDAVCATRSYSYMPKF